MQRPSVGLPKPLGPLTYPATGHTGSSWSILPPEIQSKTLGYALHPDEGIDESHANIPEAERVYRIANERIGVLRTCQIFNHWGWDQLSVITPTTVHDDNFEVRIFGTKVTVPYEHTAEGIKAETIGHHQMLDCSYLHKFDKEKLRKFKNDIGAVKQYPCVELDIKDTVRRARQEEAVGVVCESMYKSYLKDKKLITIRYQGTRSAPDTATTGSLSMVVYRQRDSATLTKERLMSKVKAKFG